MDQTKHLVRQLSIDLITDTPNSIIEWFDALWNKLTIVEINVYHKKGGELVYYIDGQPKIPIFYQDDENNRFWCNHHSYWLILKSDFNLNYYDIQGITKLLVENALISSVATPSLWQNRAIPAVENALNI